MLISIIGILILALTVLDILLTVIDASGRSIFSIHVYRGFWWFWRHLAKTMPYPVAQAALSTAMPLMTTLLIGIWIGAIVVGFALIFFGGLSFGAIIAGGGSQPSLPAAFRLSWVTLSTIGFVEISPSNMVYSVTVALEALLGSVTLTFSITYFLSVHRSILGFDRLVAELHHRTDPASNAIQAASAYLASDNVRGLERWLDRLHQSVIGIHQGLSRYPIVYFYRPRARERNLPRTLQAVSEIADGLTYCASDRTRARLCPTLTALSAGIVDLVEDLRTAYVPVADSAPARPVPFAEFEAALRGEFWSVDPMLRRFVELYETLDAKTCPRIEPAKAYDNYRQWLPAAQRTRDFVTAIARDLGYHEDLRPRRSSYLLGLLDRGPKQRPQALQFQSARQ